jgi:hypothetical protein
MMRRRLAVVAATVMLAVVGLPGIALAADTQPAVPSQTTCYPLLSSVICYLPVSIPVNVGPFGPFNFTVDMPNGLFGKPPGS